MWKIKYCPPSGENNSPYEEILKFGNPLAVKVFYQLELNAIYDSTNEWIGSVKPIKYRKENGFNGPGVRLEYTFFCLIKPKQLSF